MMKSAQIAVVTVMQQELNGSSWFINFFLCIGPTYFNRTKVNRAQSSLDIRAIIIYV
jgi:hypothetical protein